MSLFLLTVAGVVFRSELAILVATITLYLFLTRRLSIWSDIIPTGLSGLVVGLMISVPIDSFFWQSFPLWPEWTAFYYNTIQGHSADWGVSPWHFYIFNALPRLLMNPLTYLVCIPTALLSPATCGRSLDLLVPLLAFVGIYSVLPHKEWRFIIYAIPGLTAVAAAGASYLWTRRAKNALYALLSLVLVCSVFLSFAASTALLAISSLNYPGGAAVTYLHRNIQHLQPPSHHPLKAYFDNLACQTGVTRFLEDHRGGKQTQTVLDVLEAQDVASKREWVYDKTEDPELLRDPMFWTQFDYVLAERPEKVIGKWEVMHTEYGYSGIKVLRPWQKSGSGREEVSGTGKETDGTFSSRVAAFWRDLEGLLRHSVFRGWWVEIRMEPKIRILANRMEDLVHGEV
jgi:alpha-1,6-mannosyltransferase